MHFTPSPQSNQSKHDVYYEGNKKNEMNDLKKYLKTNVDISKQSFPIQTWRSTGNKSSKGLSFIQLKGSTPHVSIQRW